MEKYSEKLEKKTTKKLDPGGQITFSTMFEVRIVTKRSKLYGN